MLSRAVLDSSIITGAQPKIVVTGMVFLTRAVEVAVPIEDSIMPNRAILHSKVIRYVTTNEGQSVCLMTLRDMTILREG